MAPGKKSRSKSREKGRPSSSKGKSGSISSKRSPKSAKSAKSAASPKSPSSPSSPNSPGERDSKRKKGDKSKKKKKRKNDLGVDNVDGVPESVEDIDIHAQLGGDLDDTHTRELRVIFRLIDTDCSGKLSMMELRKALKKNKSVIKFVSASSTLAPLLVPRLFHSTLKKMDADGDGEVDFDEFRLFCKQLGHRQIIDDHAKELFSTLGAPDDLTITPLPNLLYEHSATKTYLLGCEAKICEEREEERFLERQAVYARNFSPLDIGSLGVLETKSSNNQEDPSKEAAEDVKERFRLRATKYDSWPMAAMLRPVSFRRAVKRFCSENERVTKDYCLAEIDFINLTHMIVEDWKSDLELIDVDLAPNGSAECFAEMAANCAQQCSPDYERATMFLEQSVSLSPFDKSYHLMLHENYLAMGLLEQALDSAERAMQVSEYFWPPALSALIASTKAIELEALRLKQEEEAAAAAAKEAKQKGGEDVNDDEDDDNDDDDDDDDDDESEPDSD